MQKAPNGRLFYTRSDPIIIGGDPALYEYLGGVRGFWLSITPRSGPNCPE